MWENLRRKKWLRNLKFQHLEESLISGKFVRSVFQFYSLSVYFSVAYLQPRSGSVYFVFQLLFWSQCSNFQHLLFDQCLLWFYKCSSLDEEGWKHELGVARKRRILLHWRLNDDREAYIISLSGCLPFNYCLTQLAGPLPSILLSIQVELKGHERIHRQSLASVLLNKTTF